jgi:hypothetical protein
LEERVVLARGQPFVLLDNMHPLRDRPKEKFKLACQNKKTRSIFAAALKEKPCKPD